jgi:hypothetical protein
MTERGRRIGYRPGTSPLVTLEAHPLAKNLSENKENQQSGYWVGGDLDITEVRPRDNGFSGKLVIPHGYFGEQYDIAGEIILTSYLLSSQKFSERSRLAQAGIDPEFREISLNRGNKQIEVMVDAKIHHGKPIINVPESFKLGRFYEVGYNSKLKGEALEEFAREFGEDVNVGPSKSDGIYLPIKKFFEIGAPEIDLEKVLMTNSSARVAHKRRELDDVLELEEVEFDKIRNGFVLGETKPLNVPEGQLLLVDTGYDESIGLHLPSTLLDAGTGWPIRTEQTLAHGEKYSKTIKVSVYK